MRDSFDLIAVDKSWIDVALRVPALPRADQKVLATLAGRYPGGMGGNVAAAASRLGLRCGMVSWVGDDADGRLILTDLQRFSVDTTHVLVEPGTTTNYTTILIEPSGEKAIIIVPTAFNVLDLDSHLIDYLRLARIVYTTPYDPEQLGRIAAIVHDGAGLVATDIEAVAALDDSTLQQVLAAVDIAFVHASTLAGDDHESALRKLQALGPRVVVSTSGPGDALACTVEGVVRCPPFSVPVTDTTGAGDCFAAAFLAAHLRHESPERALRYAHAAAALSVQGVGARGALPDHAGVAAFVAERSPRA